MARPRMNSSKGKGTSFGKRTDSEKAFRKRGTSSRPDGFESKRPSRPYNSSAGGEDRPKFKSGPGAFKRKDNDARGDGKPPFKRTGSSFSSSEKPLFRKPGGKTFEPRAGRDNDRGDFKKREGGASFGERKIGGRYAGGDNEKRPFQKRESPSFGSRLERPTSFRKTDSGGFDDKKPFARRTERPDGDKKPFVKREGKFDERPTPFRKTERDTRSFGDKKPFAKRTDFGSDRPEGDTKPFVKREGKFGARPDGFTKPDRTKGSESEFGRPFKKTFTKPRAEGPPSFTKRSRAEEVKKDDGLTRLNKYIANSGMGSRRDADEKIKLGLVSVNGTVITEMGYKVKKGDVVRYEDKILKAEKPVYILLNKPKGYITTTDDPQERSTVMGLVSGAVKERIYPVGRLDRNTTGLLLLTNDGDLADKLTHPSYQAKKVYKIELDKPITKNDFIKIQEGVHLEEGKARVDEIAIVSEDKKTIGLEIHIGWNRVVRRIFESLGYQVVRLDRTIYAGLDKKDLARGQWRFLKAEEIVMLKHFK
jgi:23S rRNA pseudouridine2605 synthase